MPVLGRYAKREPLRPHEIGDGVEDLVSPLHGERTPGEEVRLDVDHEEGALRVQGVSFIATSVISRV
jgi:hypothetical protein